MKERPLFISRTCLFIVTVLLFSACPFMYAQTLKPNIIIILTDDMGYGDISSFNSEYMKTPNIDRIAENGTKYTQYYSASPICSPSRVSILTGMYPANWNFTTFLNDRKSNLLAEQANYLNTQAPSMAKIFGDAGYATAHFGKWHMGGGRDVQNAPGFQNYGFDEHVSTYESPDPHPALTATNWIWSPEDSIKRWDRTKYFVDNTLQFLKQNTKNGKPSFINLWPDDMHTPWVPEVDESYIGKFPVNPTEEKAFKMVLNEYDRQIGRLLDGMDSLGITENTILIFTSDNGPLPSFRGSRSAGLRGTKLSLYEGGIRMPFIMQWPGHVPQGKSNNALLNSTDLLPSLAAMADIQLPRNYQGDGEDRHQVFLGRSSERTNDMFWEYGRNPYAFNYPPGKNKSPNLAIRSGKWKLLIDYHHNNAELYNMNDDKYEKKNVAKDHPELVNKLRQKLVVWRSYLPVLTPERMNP